MGVVATGLGRSYLGCELNPEYAEMSRERIRLALETPEERYQREQKAQGQAFLFGDP